MTILYFINQIFSLGAIGAHIFILLAIIYFMFFRKKSNFITDFIGKNGILLAFIVVFAATLGSLFYSEIAGYAPCKLCWFQRIFMYPQTILLGIAVWRKDYQIVVYGLALSVIGSFIASYHYIMQLGFVPSLPCSAVGYSASCSPRFVLQFGYITIPLMALTVFALIIIFLIFSKIYNKNDGNN